MERHVAPILVMVNQAGLLYKKRFIMLIQKAVVVAGKEVSELNILLKDGWFVKHTCGMPNSIAVTGPYYKCDYVQPHCLVILEKMEI